MLIPLALHSVLHIPQIPNPTTFPSSCVSPVGGPPPSSVKFDQISLLQESSRSAVEKPVVITNPLGDRVQLFHKVAVVHSLFQGLEQGVNLNVINTKEPTKYVSGGEMK